MRLWLRKFSKLEKIKVKNDHELVKTETKFHSKTKLERPNNQSGTDIDIESC